MTARFWNGLGYHFCSSRIVTNADKDGCRVFEISGPMGLLKVLALDQAEAELAYKEELENDPDWCSECRRYGFGRCVCEPEDEEDEED